MTLGTLILQNFRSYKKRTFTFSVGTTVIVGDNAIGKTNILEAVMLLATSKSFRADVDTEMIAWEETAGHITGVVSDETKLEIQLTDGNLGGHAIAKKRLLVNSVPRRSIDFVGHCRAVLFWPQDLELIIDSPSVRRRYLDTVLVQTDREYRRNLLSYERGLRQRNRLLDQIQEGLATRAQLLFWNQLLIKAGGYITDARAAYIAYLNSFRMGDSEYHIEYDKSVISETRLEQYKDAEIGAGATLVGPHRDDIIIKSKQAKDEKGEFRELSKYGSRGQQRLAVLWLKLGEVAFIEQAVGSRPMLLLDDIFSELDIKHREVVLAAIKQQQTLITSADPAILEELDQQTVSVITL
jgi:DNA replication and repair protein RecF